MKIYHQILPSPQHPFPRFGNSLLSTTNPQETAISPLYGPSPSEVSKQLINFMQQLIDVVNRKQAKQITHSTSLAQDPIDTNMRAFAATMKDFAEAVSALSQVKNDKRYDTRENSKIILPTNN